MSAWRRSLAAMALAAATGLAACGNDDGSTGPGERPAQIAISEVRGPLLVGQSLQLEARALDAAGQEIAVGDPTWTSSDTLVIQVTPSGLMTAANVGTAALTATINGRSGSLNLTVEPLPPTTVRVTMTGANFTPADTTIRLNGTVQFVFPATAHDIVFGTATAGAPANIGSTTNATITRQFTSPGDFTYTSTLQPSKSGVIRVR
jgi:plastocyanin